MIAKKNISNIFYLFLFSHLFLWTLIPSISNINLPLDTIEALAWGSNLDWGFSKHPPFSAFVINIIYNIFGANDWAYYFFSQICVIISFFFVWELSKFFFSNKIFSLISLLILETIFFFNYTTPEFNVYVCQLPLKAAVVYFFWKGINSEKLKYWILTGILSSFGALTHYSFIFILISLLIFLILLPKKKNYLIKNILISFSIFIAIAIPHLLWLIENNFETIQYAISRSDVESTMLSKHIYNPVLFILKQTGMILFFLITFFSIVSIKKIKKFNFNFKDKKKIFLFCITLLPLIIVFLVSLISGAKIRTMWMSTFYLFFGILFFYYFNKAVNLNKIKNFLFIFTTLFFLSPIIYFYVSITNDQKRTDFPGKEIARLVQNKWDQNFINEIKIVVGDEWYAGNLSYHLKSRPIWYNDLNNKITKIEKVQGVIYTGNPKILKEICPGEFGIIRPVGYCMIGIR